MVHFGQWDRILQGQLGNGSNENSLTPQKIVDESVILVAAGGVTASSSRMMDHFGLWVQMEVGSWETERPRRELNPS